MVQDRPGVINDLVSSVFAAEKEEGEDHCKRDCGLVQDGYDVGARVWRPSPRDQDGVDLR